jgi:hypothetical protein
MDLDGKVGAVEMPLDPGRGRVQDLGELVGIGGSTSGRGAGRTTSTMAGSARQEACRQLLHRVGCCASNKPSAWLVPADAADERP